MAGRGLVLAALLAAAVWVVASHETLLALLDPEAIQARLESLGPAAPFVFVLAMVLVVVAAPLPSLPLDIAAGHAFGWLAGGLYAAAGATLGAVVSFSIARWLGRGVVQRLLGGHATFCSGCSDAALVGVVFASRLIPFVSFDAVSYGAGLTAMSRSRFAVATFVGSLPLTFLYTSAGASLAGNLRTALWIALPVMLGVFLLPRALERVGAPLGRFVHPDGYPDEASETAD